MSEASPDRISLPVLPPDSPGSSVSATMQEEYTELLKFALTTSLQDGQEPAREELGELKKTLESVISLGSSQGQDPPEKEVHPDLDNNTNSNNLYQDSSNESATYTVEMDKNLCNREQSSSSSQMTISADVSDMRDKLDTWLGKLKGDILAELGRTVVKSSDSQQKLHEQEIKGLVADKQRLEREATRLAENVSACEQSLARKDTLVENLTQALQKSKDQVQMAKLFYTARIEAADQKRLMFTEKLAERHHEHQLVQKVMRAWFGLIQTRWRNRVQKGCEEQARNVCGQLSQDYEDKIKSLNMTIASLEQKVSFLQQERGQYAEQVRKAFMRGVCALNMETMSAFGPEENLDLDPSTGHSNPKTMSTGPATYQEDSSDEMDYSHNANTQSPSLQELVHIDRLKIVQQQEAEKQQQQQHQHRKEPRSLPIADVQITTGVIDSGTVGVQPRSLPSFSHKTKTKPVKSKGRPGSASTSGPTRHPVRSSQSQPLAPPMASVVVERHNPVTKQTLGKATAVRFPKAAAGQVSRSQPSSLIGQSFKPLAGQTGSLTMVTSSIKVVE